MELTSDVSLENDAISLSHNFALCSMASIEALSFADHIALSSSISKRASVSFCKTKDTIKQATIHQETCRNKYRTHWCCLKRNPLGYQRQIFLFFSQHFDGALRNLLLKFRFFQPIPLNIEKNNNENTKFHTINHTTYLFFEMKMIKEKKKINKKNKRGSAY